MIAEQTGVWHFRSKDFDKNKVDIDTYKTKYQNHKFSLDDDIFIKKYITYEDFKNLCNLNDEFGFDEKNYFNFFLTCPFIHIDRIGITKYFDIAFKKIIENTFNRKIKENLMRTLVGNINIYPKGSFIKKHQDNDPTNTRLFTSLFFLNHDWDKDNGSILNLYKNDELIEVIPDYKHCILIEHPNYNYVHEVTKNISELNRYSIYQPFTINDLNEILE